MNRSGSIDIDQLRGAEPIRILTGMSHSEFPPTRFRRSVRNGLSVLAYSRLSIYTKWMSFRGYRMYQPNLPINGHLCFVRKKRSHGIIVERLNSIFTLNGVSWSYWIGVRLAGRCARATNTRQTYTQTEQTNKQLTQRYYLENPPQTRTQPKEKSNVFLCIFYFYFSFIHILGEFRTDKKEVDRVG